MAKASMTRGLPVTAAHAKRDQSTPIDTIVYRFMLQFTQLTSIDKYRYRWRVKSVRFYTGDLPAHKHAHARLFCSFYE